MPNKQLTLRPSKDSPKKKVTFKEDKQLKKKPSDDSVIDMRDQYIQMIDVYDYKKPLQQQIDRTQKKFLKKIVIT